MCVCVCVCFYVCIPDALPSICMYVYVGVCVCIYIPLLSGAVALNALNRALIKP
jgi:hypothetical protein